MYVLHVWISIIKTRRLPSEKTFLSKDCNHVPWLVSDVFVDGEDEHEHEGEASAAKKVPYVVPDIKIKSTRWDFHKELTHHST